MNRKKIFVLGTRGFPNVLGGVEKHCEEIYSRIASMGYDVTVLTRTPYIPKPQRIIEWKGIKFIHIWCPRKKSLESIVHSLIGVVVAFLHSADVLHVHSIGPAIVIPLAKMLGMRVIMTHHGPDYQRQKWGKIAKLILKLGEYLGIKYSDKIIVISNVIKEHLNKYKTNKVVLIPNGISVPELIPPNETLSKYGLKPRGYIFTACRFVPEKGLDDLINAYVLIGDKKDFSLVIAGDSDHESAYSRKIKHLSVIYNIILTGNKYGKELGELFTNAGLFVLPSYYEGLPIALLEALSYNIPVLVSDIPQHKEINLPGFRYFKTGDVKELSSKMKELFNRNIEKSEINIYHSWFDEKYNWDKISRQVINLYSSID